MDTVRIGIIGCGNIAGAYAKNIRTYAGLELAGVADVDGDKARAFAAEHQAPLFPDPNALLGSDIDIAVNLTSHFAHYDVTTAALNAGKHVFSEKPLATTAEQARALVNLARDKGLRLGCAPFTLMGEAQQTAWKLIREGRLGTVRLAYAEVNWGRIESWHPAPGPFYEVGALFDVGVYPLTILTSMFGAARRVQAYGTVLHPDRVTKEGVPFHISTPDFVVTMIELASGTVVRLTTNFYVGHHNKQTGIEFHGDAASLHLKSWQNFDSEVAFSPFGEQYTPVELLRPAQRGTPWGAGVHELASALREGRPHRFTGEQAAHVVDILTSAARSMQTGQPVALTSDFTPPAPMDWAL